MLSSDDAKRAEQKQHRTFLKNLHKIQKQRCEIEDRNGVLGEGGLSLWIEPGDRIYIGSDIELILQKNNSRGSKFITIRIKAPKDVKIEREHYRGKKSSSRSVI